MIIKSLIKGLTKFIVLMALILVMSISFYITTKWLEFQKVYNSYEDNKLSHKIENKLEKLANSAKRTKKPLSINLDELTDDRQIDKICVAGPYNSDVNKVIGVDWKQSQVWDRQVGCNDTLRSIFLIYDNKVIPIKVKINKIEHILINQPCMQINNGIIFELIENNSNVYLKITN